MKIKTIVRIYKVIKIIKLRLGNLNNYLNGYCGFYKYMRCNDNAPEKSKCNLSCESDETINHLISECSKQLPKKVKLGWNEEPLGIVQMTEISPY